jgi:hypothetical protein
MRRPHPHLLETGAIWGSAPARLTVWSSHLFYWPKPFHWVPLTFGASVECLVLTATCLYFRVCAVFFFSERRNGPFPTQAHVSEAAHGPAYDPQDAQEVQSTTCPPLFVFDVVALPDRTPLPRCLPWAGQAPFLAWRYSSRCLVGSVVSSPGFVVLRSWR